MEGNFSEAHAIASNDIISERANYWTTIVLRVCVNSVLSLGGLVTNIINGLVFWRLGINDSSTGSFFILSVSDGFIGFLGINAGIVSTLRYVGPYNKSGYSLYILLLSVATVASLSSTVCTVVIDVVRCFCVAMPLQVRWIFTARRQRLFIGATTAVSLAFMLYGLSSTTLVIRRDPASNVSQVVIVFGRDYVERSQFADVYRGVMFYACFIAVSVCLVILLVALRRSRRFRDLAAVPHSRGSTRSSGSQTLTKEAQAIKVVVLVSAIFVTCNFPAMVASILRQTVSGFSNIGRLRRSYDVLMNCVESVFLLNACVNIITYYFLNTRYRKVFWELFGCR